MEQVYFMTNKELQEAIDKTWEMYDLWRTKWEKSKEIGDHLVFLLKLQRARSIQSVFNCVDGKPDDKTTEMIKTFFEE